MDEDSYHFHIADYIIFALMLCISAAIGVYYACTGNKQRTASEYLMGNRNMGKFPIAMSLTATVLSSLTMLGMPWEIYTYGIHFYYRGIGVLLAIVFSAIYTFVPVFYNLRLTSVYEYVELRFNKTLRYIASGLYILAMIIYASFVIYAPAIFLRQVTGVNIWWSILSVGLIGTVYTAIGGIKAVMWTDVIQSILMFVSLIIVCVKGAVDVGGISILIERNSMGSRLEPLSFSFDPRIRYTFWGSTVGPFFMWSVIYGVYQTQVQRYLCAPTMKEAQKSLWWSFFGFIVTYSACCFIGLVMYAKYWQCDPFLSSKLATPNQILPYFVMETIGEYPGLAGVFIAGIYSGSLSSISSVFNSLAAVVLEDFVRQNKRWQIISEEEAAKISKVIAMSFGLLCLILASLGDYFGPLIQSSEYNVCVFTSALFVIFALGLFFPWTTSLGALIGTTLGLSLGFWLSIGSQLNRYVPPHPPISVEGCPVDANIINVTSQFNEYVDVLEPYKISYVWLTTWVVFCGVVIGVFASFITGPGNLNSVDPQLLAPITNFILKKIYKKKFRGYTESREISTVDVSLIVKPISEYAVNATRRNKIPPERFVSLIPSTQV